MIEEKDIDAIDTLDEYYSFTEKLYRQSIKNSPDIALFRKLRIWEIDFESHSDLLGKSIVKISEDMIKAGIKEDVFKNIMPMILDVYKDHPALDKYYSGLSKKRKEKRVKSLLAYFLAKKKTGESANWYVEGIIKKVEDERNARKIDKKDRG